MKRFIEITAVLALASCLFSCHKEITIPDPGFDMSETVLDTVRRDTTDVYRIAFNVKAPNGVRYIQLLNGRNFEVMQEFDEYAGQTNFEFRHEFNYSSTDPEIDSLFIYNIKIRTNDNRGYNKSIRIQQKRKSHPEINGPSSNTMNIFGRAFVFDGTINTGFYSIESIKVTLNGEELKHLTAADLNGASTYRLYHKLTRDFIPGEKYVYNVIVKDSRGEEKTFSYNLVGAVLKKPVALKYAYGSSSGTATTLHYNEQGLLERLYEPYGGYVNCLRYDEEGRLIMLFASSTSYMGDPMGAQGAYGYGLYVFYQYNDDGSVRRFGDGGYSTTVQGTVHKFLDPFWNRKEYIADNVSTVTDLNGTDMEGWLRSLNTNDPALNKYIEHNGKRYTTDMTGTNTNHIGPFEFVEGFEEGEYLYTGIVGSNMQGVHPFYGTNGPDWAQFTAFVPVMNPLYIKDYPTYLHKRYQGPISVLFGCKYVPSSIIRPNGKNTADLNISYPIPYTVREDGLLKTIGTITSGIPGSTPAIYTFYYDDEPEDGWKDYLNASAEAIMANDELFK